MKAQLVGLPKLQKHWLSKKKKKKDFKSTHLFLCSCQVNIL